MRQNACFAWLVSADFANAVLNYLDATYYIDTGRWIGRGNLLLDLNILRTLILWISCSITPWNQLFIRRLWIHWRSTTRIAVATADIANTLNMILHARQSFVRRSRLCNDLRGRNFEQLTVTDVIMMLRCSVVFFLKLYYNAL